MFGLKPIFDDSGQLEPRFVGSVDYKNAVLSTDEEGALDFPFYRRFYDNNCNLDSYAKMDNTSVEFFNTRIINKDSEYKRYWFKRIGNIFAARDAIERITFNR